MAVWDGKRVLVWSLILISALGWTSGSGLAQQALTRSTGQAQANGSAQPGLERIATLSRGDGWTDTGIELEPGNELQIEVANSPRGAVQSPCKAAPTASPTEPRLRINSANPSALVAKLAASAQPFPVAESRKVSITEAGHLYLALNDMDSCAPGTAVKVRVAPSTASVVKNKLGNAAQIWLSGQFGKTAASSGTESGNSTMSNTGAVAAKATPALNVSSQALDSQLREKIDHCPRRVNDQFNNPGDMVNFVIIGSQQQVETALNAADWHLADTSNSDAITKAIEMTRHNKDYIQMPMSLLYLFGRAQDFGYEQAEPYAVVASRHHFRLWKAPFTYKGQPVWLGAGTHDIGFEKDQRNGSVTHKIDPDVDGERQNIGESLQKTGLVQELTEYLPPDPVQSANNATGGGYHSDGRILVITLK